MAIEVEELRQYLIDLQVALEDAVASRKSAEALTKIQEQIKHIEKLIQIRSIERNTGTAQ